MNPLRSEPAPFLKHFDGTMIEISGLCVDELPHTDDEFFLQLCRKTFEKFNMGEAQGIPCTFTRLSLYHDEHSAILQHQNLY